MLRAVRYYLSEVPQLYWDFVHKYGAIYQSKAYLEFLADSGREPLVIAVYSNEELVGGTAVNVGRKVFKIPFSMTVYYGPVVKEASRIKEVLHKVVEAVKSSSIVLNIHIPGEYTSEEGQCGSFSQWHKKPVEYLRWDISPPIEDLRKNLGKGKKSGINRAVREGVVIEKIESPDQVAEFFKVYSMSMHRSKLDPGLISTYKDMLLSLGAAGMAAGFLALHPATGQTLAGRLLLLGLHGDATFLASGHDPTFRKLRGGDLLTWHCVEYAKSKGYTEIDFVGLPVGDSKRESGLRDSKLSWAGSFGKRYRSFILSRGIFGLNPTVVLKTVVCFKKGLWRIFRIFGIQK